MGTNSIQRVSATQGAQFEKFTKEASKDYENLIGNILNGTITTEEQRERENFRIFNKTFEVLSDEYRTLADKKNKTPEEIQRMKDMYKNGFLNFGESYINYVDSVHGNKDNKLTENEFVKSQVDPSMSDEISPDEQKVMARNVFAHLDMNKDGKADKKEVAAMMSLFDMSIGHNGDKPGKVDGKIKVVDYSGRSMNLVKPSSENGGSAMDTLMQTMYNFLFGNE